MASVVGIRGQIVIEKAIRDALSVRPGHIAVQRLAGDHVEITFVEPEHDRSLRGILATVSQPSVSAEDWPAAREAAWRAAADDRSAGESADG